MRSMRLVVVIAAVLVAGVTATSSAAATATPVSIKLVESLRSPVFTQDCPDLWTDFNCGTGLMRPFGQAKSEVLIGICGDSCNIRIITVASGTIVLRETLSDLSCPGVCETEWPHGNKFAATLTAEVVDGTGVFAGATGTFNGSLSAAALQAQIHYSGVVTLVG